MDKILLVTTDYLPMTGGVANYYYNLTRGIPDMKILTNVAGEPDDKTIRDNFTRSLWPTWWPLISRVIYWHKKLKPNYIGVGQILPVGTAVWLGSFFNQHKYIVFLHGYDISLTLKNPWKKLLASCVLLRASRIIVNSQATKERLSYYKLNPNKIITINPTIANLPKPTVEEVNNFKQAQGLAGKKVVLSVARLVKRKNIDLVLKSVAELQKQFADLLYVVIGNGPEAENLKNLAQQLNVNVKWLGEVTDAVQKSLWYSACDIFCLTPKFDQVDVEGFGIVYLEAMYYNKPCVASRTGGITEALAGAGLYIDNESELTEKLKELLSNDELKTRLIQAGTRQVQQFTITRQCDKLVRALYD